MSLFFPTVLVAMSTVFRVGIAPAQRIRPHCRMRERRDLIDQSFRKYLRERTCAGWSDWKRSYSSCSSSESIVLSFASSSGLIREKAIPKLLPSTQRTVASSILNGQSRPGMWSRHSSLAPCITLISLSILHPPTEISRVLPCPSCFCPEKVLRNWVVNLGWTRRSSGRGLAGFGSDGFDLKSELSFFKDEILRSISSCGSTPADRFEP